MMKSFLNLTFNSLLLLTITEAFQLGSNPTTAVRTNDICLHAATGIGQDRQFKQEEEDRIHFLLEEFTTAGGELLNPYEILKVPRNAERTEIRNSYRQLSRKYHPDGVRHRKIFPGKCNNLDDVADHWERIKLSYEILIDSRTRRRYDRHELIADPGSAMKRAALDTVGKGIKGMGQGMFEMGAFAMKQITGDGEK